MYIKKIKKIAKYINLRKTKTTFKNIIIFF